jgi:hypothetical protein
MTTARETLHLTVHNDGWPAYPSEVPQELGQDAADAIGTTPGRKLTGCERSPTVTHAADTCRSCNLSSCTQPRCCDATAAGGDTRGAKRHQHFSCHVDVVFDADDLRQSACRSWRNCQHYFVSIILPS